MPPSLHLSPQRDGSNLYMTLHVRKVDGRTVVGDGHKPVHVPSGWEIAPGDAHDIRVCGAHPWQSHALVFSNGDGCGTAMDSSAGATLNPSKNVMFSRLKIGKKFFSPDRISDWLLQDKQGARAKHNSWDVLLRRRA